MSLGRLSRNALRGLLVWVVLTVFAVMYGLRRLTTLAIRDRRERRRAVSRLQGRMLRT